MYESCKEFFTRPCSLQSVPVQRLSNKSQFLPLDLGRARQVAVTRGRVVDDHAGSFFTHPTVRIQFKEGSVEQKLDARERCDRHFARSPGIRPRRHDGWERRIHA